MCNSLLNLLRMLPENEFLSFEFSFATVYKVNNADYNAVFWFKISFQFSALRAVKVGKRCHFLLQTYIKMLVSPKVLDQSQKQKKASVENWLWVRSKGSKLYNMLLMCCLTLVNINTFFRFFANNSKTIGQKRFLRVPDDSSWKSTL